MTRRGGRAGVRIAPGRALPASPRLARVGLLALALSACAPEPATPPAAPEVVALARPDEVEVSGRVALDLPGGATRAVAGADVLFVPEEAMRPFVVARLEVARSGLAALQAEREQARRRREALLAEADRTNREWKAANESELRRRLEAQVRPPRGAEGVRAIHRRLLAEKQASWAQAGAAARRSDEAEREVRSLELRAGRYREGAFFLEGLPTPARAVRTDADGRFGARLAPGRYAVVATGEAHRGAAVEAVIWLVWADVGAPEARSLALTGANLLGAGAADSVVDLAALTGQAALAGGRSP